MVRSLPIEHKYCLTLDEAAEYAGIDASRMRSIADSEEHSLIFWIGSRRYIRRKNLEIYIKDHYDELKVQEGEIIWTD